MDLIGLEPSPLDQQSYRNVDRFTLDRTFVGLYNLVIINIKTLYTKSITTFRLIHAPVTFANWFHDLGSIDQLIEASTNTLGYNVTEHGEKERQEDYTTSVAQHTIATDVV